MGSDLRFSVVRKGYDIAEVDNHLRSLRRASHHGSDELQIRIDQLEAELAEARKREEAVQLTLVAATQTKEQMLQAAHVELDQAASQARSSADDMVSEAQFEAFRLVTQAKEDAEATIQAAQAEAARIATQKPDAASPAAEAVAASEVNAEALSKLEQARDEAIATIREIREEAEEVIAERDRKITMLQAQLDEASEQTLSTEVPTDAIAEAAIAPPIQIPDALEEEPTEPTVRGDEPAGVPRVTVEDTDVQPLSDRPARGSFYTRRSARLPRIGSDAANGALAAVSAMRSKSRDQEDAEGVPSDTTEDMAMQTA